MTRLEERIRARLRAQGIAEARAATNPRFRQDTTGRQGPPRSERNNAIIGRGPGYSPKGPQEGRQWIFGNWHVPANRAGFKKPSA